MQQNLTLASMAYERLRADIISGMFRPGEKLRINSICESYDIGPSPMREALNRLSSEGLLQQTDQRGFRIPPVTLKDLDELLRARCWANEVSLRNSIRTGGLEWEARVSSAFEILEATPPSLKGDTEILDAAWCDAHENFHAALLSECGSSWIYDFCTQTYIAAERYRHAARITKVQRSDLEEHRVIANAALSRREDEAVELLLEHFRKTARIVRDWLLKQPADGLSQLTTT